MEKDKIEEPMLGLWKTTCRVWLAGGCHAKHRPLEQQGPHTNPRASFWHSLFFYRGNLPDRR